MGENQSEKNIYVRGCLLRFLSKLIKDHFYNIQYVFSLLNFSDLFLSDSYVSSRFWFLLPFSVKDKHNKGQWGVVMCGWRHEDRKNWFIRHWCLYKQKNIYIKQNQVMTVLGLRKVITIYFPSHRNISMFYLRVEGK